MNTPTPTPRTDAAWNATFDSEQISAGQTARALREFSQQLETELNAATAERDLLRACLIDLVDEQNGAPLELRRKQWQASMDEALAALTKTEDDMSAPTCGELSCDECNARTAAITTERDQLRAELQKVYALVTPVGFDLPGGIFETAQAVTELRAERDQLRADRTYNHECINRLAVATGTLGEKSEKVVDVVLSTIDQLHALQLVCGTTDADKFLTWVDRANARAERAEAELAKERARLDSGQILLTVAGERAWYCGVDLRAAIDAGMREGAK